jgi:signal peptide peptidase SppA
MLKKLAQKRHLNHLARRLVNTPMAIEERAGRAVLYAIGDRLGIDKKAFEGWDDENPAADTESRAYEIVNGVAIVPIIGELCHRSSFADAMSGLTSYATIVTSIQQAVDDPMVKAVMLDIDSPGGEVAGLYDCVDAIVAMRGIKPIVAYANERAFSAAYAIASAADRIVVSRTSGVGSIGVLCFHVDRSEAYAMAGEKITPIHAGALKVDGNEFTPLSDETKSRFQAEVDSAYDIFVASVADNRDLDESDVRATEAGCFYGLEAVREGLADEVLSFGDALRGLSADHEFTSTEIKDSNEDGDMADMNDDEELKSARKAKKARRAAEEDENLLDAEGEDLDDENLDAEDDEDNLLDAEDDEEDLEAEGEELDDNVDDEDGEDDEVVIEVESEDEEDEEDDKPVARKAKKAKAKKAADEDEFDKVAARRGARKSASAASTSGRTISASTAAGIVRMCNQSGVPHLAEGLIKRGASLKDAQRTINKQGAIAGLIKKAARVDPTLKDAKEAQKIMRASAGSVDTARKLLFDRLAASSRRSTVASHHAPGPSIVNGKDMGNDADAIYARRVEKQKAARAAARNKR